MLKAFVCEVFVCGWWHRSLCHLFISWMYTVYTHSHPPSTLTTHSMHSNTHATDTFTHTQMHMPLPFSRSVEAPDRTWPLRCCACSTCAHLRTHAFPAAGLRQAGPVSTRTRRAGVLSASLLSLTCSTCPVFSSLQSAFDWVQCQSLPGTEPRAASEKQISCGNEPPRAQMGACQLWKDHQEKRPCRWPLTPHQCSGEPWDESAYGFLFSSLLSPPQISGHFEYSRPFPN